MIFPVYNFIVNIDVTPIAVEVRRRRPSPSRPSRRTRACACRVAHP